MIENSKKLHTCAGCGKQIIKYDSQIKKSLTIFCTKLCRNTNYKKANPEWHPSNYGIFTKEKELTCGYCGKKFKRSQSNTDSNKENTYCSERCYHSGRIGQRRTPHTDETKRKISQKQKEYCALHGNQFLIGISKGRHDKETISRISSKNIGKDPQWKGRIFEYDGPKGKFKMRSSYELAYAKWLDNRDIDWKYEPIYKLSNGKSFAPDFILSDGQIIEIKGYLTPKGKEKWDLFCKDYPEIKKIMLFRDNLREMGVL